MNHSEAVALGLEKYDTGRPCRRGHRALRYTVNRACVECANDTGNDWAKANPEKRRQILRSWRDRNREKVRSYTRDSYARNIEIRRRAARERYAANPEKYRTAAKRSRQKNPEKSRDANRKWNAANREKRRNASRRFYGLPVPTRPEPEMCECCGRKPGARGMHLDHDHRTGEFRGWLCHHCNVGIGNLGDSMAGLQMAMKYLRRASASGNESLHASIPAEQAAQAPSRDRDRNGEDGDMSTGTRLGLIDRKAGPVLPVWRAVPCEGLGVRAHA